MYLHNDTLLQGGKYRIVRHISSGGFGNTYEGVHTMMDTRVAIKEFYPKMFCNRDESTSHITVATQSNHDLVEKLRKKFIDEAKAIFKMNHPNIVKVHDIFEENGTAYYVMDYIDGKSLSDIVKQRGKLPEVEALNYIRQVADALKYVHSLNRLHLDIKPANVMANSRGHAVLIDFGTSKHYDMESGDNTSTLMGVNTKGYAPVEQSTQSFTKFSPATDIYALGATLYKLLTGITPPDANLLSAGEEVLLPLPSNISAATSRAVTAAMALKRADRPQSVEGFLATLGAASSQSAGDEETMLENDNTPTPPPSDKEPPPINVAPPKADNSGLWKLVACLTAVAAIAAIIIAVIVPRKSSAQDEGTSASNDTVMVNTDEYAQEESAEEYEETPESSYHLTPATAAEIRTVTKNAFVRTGPGTQYEPKYSPYCDFDSNNTNGVVVYAGTKVEVLGAERNGFVHVRQTALNNDRDDWDEGWVSAKFLR